MMTDNNKYIIFIFRKIFIYFRFHTKYVYIYCLY